MTPCRSYFMHCGATYVTVPLSFQHPSNKSIFKKETKRKRAKYLVREGVMWSVESHGLHWSGWSSLTSATTLIMGALTRATLSYHVVLCCGDPDLLDQ